MNIVISTEQSLHHEWMAFCCWYSIHRNLPTAKVAVVFPRAYKSNQFLWLNKCDVPYLSHNNSISVEQAIDILVNNDIISKPILILHDYMMLIRKPTWEINDIQCGESQLCSSENPVALVDYRKCGNFSLEEWVQKEQRHPFYRTHELTPLQRTVNEQKVFQLWKQMGITFDFLYQRNYG